METIKSEIQATRCKDPIAYNFFANFVLTKVNVQKEVLFDVFRQLMVFEQVS